MALINEGRKKMDNFFKGFAAAVAAVVTYLFGGWSALLNILLIFVAVDYITGVAAAGKRGELSSSVGMWGIAKKVSIFLIVAIGYLIDGAVGTDTLIRDAAIYFYMANELISLLENLGEIGVPLPPVISQAVAILKAKSDVKLNE